MKNILVTGSTGMVGRNFIDVAVNKYNLFTPHRNELNLEDYKSVVSYLEETRPDIIIHCAGLVGGITINMKYPVEFLMKNIEIGKNLVLAAKNVNIKRLINLGSSCMYPHKAVNPLKEKYILTGSLEETNEGYALAKIVLHRLCLYINREYKGFQFKTVIPCNLYGPWDKFDPERGHMIASVIRKIHMAKENQDEIVEIWGDGSARREFMYARDLGDFLVFCLDKYESVPDVINVGIGKDYSILEYYNIIKEVIGYNGSFKLREDLPVGMKQKLVDIEKIQNLGWVAKTDIRDGIEKTYNFFLKNEVF